ncbi:hypothetical protein F5Y09DRAFT_132630 [Xylaria sp. FL1042]|nr:hypothetical protein F5Y09DRAFT_132630 [Xylaria sp. FL1042]
MPSRVNLPKLSLSSSQDFSSPISYFSFPALPSNMPASSSATNKPNSLPVSPPPRLHLRNILPASPEEPPILPPPPRTPRPWVWQCHKCQSVYQLGCTRRCLDCSHTYCLLNPRTQQSQSSSPGPKKKKRQRRREAGGLCSAGFDYIGWEQWGSWRRKVNGHEAAGRCETEARDRAFLKKRHNCWIDCDSPSECCYRRFELVAAEDLRRKEMWERMLAETKKNDFVPSVNNHSHDQGSVDLELDDPFITTGALGGNGNVEGEEPPPKSPLGQSSFLWDDNEDEEEERERRREEEEEEEERKWWAAITSIAAPDSPAQSLKVSSTTASLRIPGLDLTEELPGSDLPGVDMDSQDWTKAVRSGIPSELQDRSSSRLTVRNFTENDIPYGSSDSDSESDGSSWSVDSSESDDSSVDARSIVVRVS